MRRDRLDLHLVWVEVEPEVGPDNIRRMDLDVAVTYHYFCLGLLADAGTNRDSQRG
jgi:hypothetical protein